MIRDSAGLENIIGIMILISISSVSSFLVISYTNSYDQGLSITYPEIENRFDYFLASDISINQSIDDLHSLKTIEIYDYLESILFKSQYDIKIDIPINIKTQICELIDFLFYESDKYSLSVRNNSFGQELLPFSYAALEYDYAIFLERPLYNYEGQEMKICLAIFIS